MSDTYTLCGEISQSLSVATDEFLTCAAKSGDRLAFEELWTRHSKKALNVAYQITRNRYDAEDVVQDAWLRAYLHLNTFDGRSRFSTWVVRIAINSALGVLRKKYAHRDVSMYITDGDTWTHREIADENKSVEGIYAERESVERLRRAISGLPTSLRDVVEIYRSGDRSVKEIADLVGISVGATKTRLFRARQVLRRRLTPK